ncbi:MAG: histidinol-phosphate transaminase [Gammaproteobacteria bacterium]|nr:histidinol-phosphate transaminase [Gammaproteobacteria bacterium]
MMFNNSSELNSTGLLQCKPVKSLYNLSAYIPGKPIELIEREYGIKGAIKLASNENPYGVSLDVINYLSDKVNSNNNINLYPDGNGYYLKEALADHHKVSTDMITLGNGSNDVLDIITRCFATHGDEVIFSQYAFAVYAICTQAVGAKAVMTPALDWGYDLQAILDAITDKTKIIFIANPNNPTGTCLSGKDLKNFIDQVPANILVVIDEAYVEYASHELSPWHEQYESCVNWLKNYPNLVVTQTFSKAYALAAMRIGYSLSHPQVADFLNRVRQPFNNNQFALDAANIALNDQEHIQSVSKNNWLEMEVLTKALNKLSLNYIPSAGNFISVNFDKVKNGDAQKVDQYLLTKGIIVRPVGNYGMNNYLRISLGTSYENQKLIDALEGYLS